MPEVISVFGTQFTGYMVHAVMFGCAFVGVCVTALIITVLDMAQKDFRNGDSNGPTDLRRGVGNDVCTGGDET